MTITPAFFTCMLLSDLYPSWSLRKKMHVYTSELSNILMVYIYLFESNNYFLKKKNNLTYSTCIECICYFQIFYQVFYLKVTDKSRSGCPQITYLLHQRCVQDFVTILRLQWAIAETLLKKITQKFRCYSNGRTSLSLILC